MVSSVFLFGVPDKSRAAVSESITPGRHRQVAGLSQCVGVWKVCLLSPVRVFQKAQQDKMGRLISNDMQRLLAQKRGNNYTSCGWLLYATTCGLPRQTPRILSIMWFSCHGYDWFNMNILMFNHLFHLNLISMWHSIADIIYLALRTASWLNRWKYQSVI